MEFVLSFIVLSLIKNKLKLTQRRLHAARRSTAERYMKVYIAIQQHHADSGVQDDVTRYANAS